MIEVISESTQAFKRTEKFRFYRSIAEFREYILVEQNQFLVQQYVKIESAQWLFQEYEGQETIVPFTSVGVEIAMAEIYEGVTFE